MVKDLTKGEVRSVLWLFTIPMFVSVVFQQIYNIADSAIAGRFAGENALAAVGASYPITMIFMSIAVGCNVGCAVVISKAFGGGDIIGVKTATYTTIISGLVLSASLTAIGLFISPILLQMIKTPANIFNDGDAYLKIYIGGLVFLFLYNMATGIFTSLGDSRTPLYFLIGSSIGNIILDILFVKNFGWGVKGVAWATFIAQGVACVLALISLYFRLKTLKCDERRVHYFSKKMLVKISRIAVPSILQQSFVSIGNIFIQNLVNGFGSGVIAGYSAAVKLNTFAITSFATLGNGLSTFSAQNLGAGSYTRIKKGFFSGAALSWIISIIFFVAYFFFAENVLLLFIENRTGEALATGRQFLHIVAPFYFIICIKLLSDGGLRGLGDMSKFMISTFTDLILRVGIAYVLVNYYGSTGIWISWPIGWVIAAIISTCFIWSNIKKLTMVRKTT
ncbi:MATE family efflux transporter [Eubacterium xylanophilum]|uniref:MATE family efflux transporter n=1 Tax=Eubacterium xylanophilum TaxID=39497 RepID=UPI0004AE8DA4|nr:MATE family efflux transporter [Eubacterium xylanophilum]